MTYESLTITSALVLLIRSMTVAVGSIYCNITIDPLVTKLSSSQLDLARSSTLPTVRTYLIEYYRSLVGEQKNR